MSFCVYCGKTIPDGSKFCTFCGKPVRTASPTPVGTTQQPVQQPVQKPVQQPVQQPVQKPVQQPTQQPAQKPTQQPVQKPVQQPTQQTKYTSVSDIDLKNFKNQRDDFLTQNDRFNKQNIDREGENPFTPGRTGNGGINTIGTGGTTSQPGRTGNSGIGSTGTGGTGTGGTIPPQSGTGTGGKGGKTSQGGSNNKIVIVIVVILVIAAAIAAFLFMQKNGKKADSEKVTEESAAAETTGTEEAAAEISVTEEPEEAQESASVEETEAVPVYTVSYTAGEGGQVAHGKELALELEQEVTSASEIEEITAVPDDGYSFVSWTDRNDNVVSEDAAFTADTEEAAEYTANFEIAVFDDWHDDVLKGCVAQALGKDATEITAADLEQVTKLFIIGEGATTDDSIIQQLHADCDSGAAGRITLTDLEDIGNFTNLEVLYLQYCNLDSDVLASLELPDTVYLLNLDNNNLTNLDGLAGSKGLDVVSARSNSIKDYSGIENLGLSNWDFTNNPVSY